MKRGIITRAFIRTRDADEAEKFIREKMDDSCEAEIALRAPFRMEQVIYSVYAGVDNHPLYLFDFSKGEFTWYRDGKPVPFHLTDHETGEVRAYLDSVMRGDAPPVRWCQAARDIRARGDPLRDIMKGDRFCRDVVVQDGQRELPLGKPAWAEAMEADDEDRA